MPITAAAVTGGASLLGAGLSIWANSSALSESRKEARRAEALRIKFAGEENQRNERQFARTEAFNREQFDFTKSEAGLNRDFQERQFAVQKGQKNIDNTQTIITNLMNLMNSNREQGLNLANFNRGRR